MGPVAAIAGAGLAIGGAILSHKAAKKQQKLQKKANAAMRAQDNMRAARERREAIRNARIASAEMAQGAANDGVSGSSAALGGLGSIQSQLNQGLSFLDGFNRLSDQASELLGRANKAGVQSGAWGSVSNFGVTVFANAAKLAGGGAG